MTRKDEARIREIVREELAASQAERDKSAMQTADMIHAHVARERESRASQR